MPAFLIILLKINLVLMLFAAAYYLVLRRLTFYVVNRLFLVFGILFSTVYPFINLTDFFHRQKQINQEVVAFVPKLNQEVTALVPSRFIEMNWQLISILFYAGVVLMAIRLVIQFISLYKMHQKSEPGAIANFSVRILNEAVSPFSFWQTIYINPSLHKEKELQTILAHEQIHVKEWHSLDIILAELSVVFYWFNPGVWLMKRAVKENLEFITDEKILKKGVDKKTYQYSLLDVGNLTPSVAIVNNFNLSDLKKRIKMMNVKRSSRLTLSRYLLVLPILLATTLAFTITKKDLKKHLLPLKQVLISANLIEHTKQTVKAIPLKQLAKKQKLNLPVIAVTPDTSHRFTYIINNVIIDSGSIPAPVKIHTIAVRSATADPKLVENLMGHVKGDFLVSKTDTLQRGNGVQGVKNIRIEFKTSTNNIAPADKRLPGVIKIQGFGVQLKTDSVKTGDLTYMLNGKKITREDLDKLNPEDIKAITVSKETDSKPNEIFIIARKKP